MIHITVPGAPIPQPRHRTVMMSTGRKCAGGQPEKAPRQIAAERKHPIWEWRAKIREAVLAANNPHTELEVYARPVVAARFVMPRSGAVLKRKPNPPRGGGGRGDIDNLLKPFLDVWNDLGIWVDDGRVWLVAGMLKREASGDNPKDRPRAEFTVWDASQFTLETWVQWSIDSWPVEWSPNAIVKE